MTGTDEATPKCPLCSSEKSRFLFCTRNLHSLAPEQYKLFCCRTCSHRYIHPQPGQDELARYYRGGYWSEMETAGEIDAGVRRLLARLQREHPGGRVLDVGCAAGRKTSVMRDMGLDVVGLEPYEEGCHLAGEAHGLEVVCAYLQNADLPRESFDAITFFDVIEHVRDPLGDLKAARTLLRPGGAIYLKVPNLRSWQARLLGRWWAVLDPPRHLHHFTPSSLRHALLAADFKEVWSCSPPDPLAASHFEQSIILRLRDLLWARRGITVTAAEDMPGPDVLEAQVCPTVPRAMKRIVRKLARYILYAPVACENLVSRSTTLLGGGVR